MMLTYSTDAGRFDTTTYQRRLIRSSLFTGLFQAATVLRYIRIARFPRQRTLDANMALLPLLRVPECTSLNVPGPSHQLLERHG